MGRITRNHVFRVSDKVMLKVCKGAKISNRYNQVPHLTKDTNRKVTNSQLYNTNESQEVSRFLAGDLMAQINRCTQRHNKHKTERTYNIHKRGTSLERSVKYLTTGLLRKTFSKFYRRYYDLISKFQVGLKSLLRLRLSEPDFYGDLVYKLKKIVGSNNFSAQFIKIISHYKKIGYNINVLQQTACLVVNPITVGNFAFLFNCTLVGRTSDSMMVPT